MMWKIVGVSKVSVIYIYIYIKNKDDVKNYGRFKSFGFICIYSFYNADVLKIKMTWKIVRASKASVLYVYID